jgi:hypothetical protein
MAAAIETRQATRSGTCATHGAVQAVKEVPVFRAPGLFWAFRYLGSLGKPYRCPECGAKVS